MGLVRGFTDILNPVNIFGDSFIGGGGLEFLFPWHSDNLPGTTAGEALNNYLYVYKNQSVNGCDVTDVNISRTSLNRDEVELRITATVTCKGTGENIPYFGLRTTQIYSGYKTCIVSMKSNNDTPSLVLMQNTNSTLLYRNFNEPMSKDKWTDGVIITYGPGTDMDLRFCWRLDDNVASHNPGDTYQVDFSIKGIAIYDGCYVNPPFKPTLASSVESRLLLVDGSNPQGSDIFSNNHINKLYKSIPQNKTPIPIYWNFMRSRANLGTSMVLKAKVYIYGTENYVSQSYHEWDLFFHMIKGSGSGYPWTLVEKTFALVKTSNSNGSQLNANNVTIEHNVVGTGSNSRVYLYVKLNQTVNAANLHVFIIPDACTTTRNLSDTQSLAEWTTSMAS